VSCVANNKRCALSSTHTVTGGYFFLFLCYLLQELQSYANGKDKANVEGCFLGQGFKNNVKWLYDYFIE